MQVIKHVNNHFDCFSGIGYDVHTRLQAINTTEGRSPAVGRNFSLRYVSGQRLPQTVVKQLVEQLNTTLHYQKLDI